MTDTTPIAPTYLPLSTIFDDSRPTFLIHKSWQYSGRLGEVADSLAVLHKDKLGIGVVAPMFGYKRQKVRQFLEGLDQVPFRIADPDLHRYASSGWVDFVERKAESEWTFSKEIPKKPKSSWVAQVLDAQREAHATVLLSASGWVDSVDATKSLTTAMSFVKESRAQAGSSRMMVNLTLDSAWLSNEALRDILLSEVVDSSEDAWYLRFYWPEMPVRYGQLVEPAILNGYRVLAETFASEDKQLFLPNSGLTGWIATALGATGFSTGLAWPEQAFARQRKMGGVAGRTPPPRIKRLFDKQLLHTMEFTEHERLKELDDRQIFDTKFSLEIEADDHSPELAGLHYLQGAGTLQAELVAKRSAEKAALRAINAGEKWIESLRRADRPSGLNRPQHLPAWQALLKR